MAKDIFDQIVQETESEDFNCLDQPDYKQTEIPASKQQNGMDASLPDSDDRNLKTRS